MRDPYVASIILIICAISVSAAASEDLQFEGSVRVAARAWENRVKEGRGSRDAWAHYTAAKLKPSVEVYEACIDRSIADRDALGEAVCSLDVVESVPRKMLDIPWAEQKQRRAAELFWLELGERSSARGLALCNVGNYESTRGARADAIASYELALEIQKEVLHPQHREISDTNRGLAGQLAIEHPAKAERLLWEALSIHQSEPQPLQDDQAMVTLRLSLAGIRQRQKDPVGAIAHCAVAARMARKTEGAYSLLAARVLVETGYILRQQGRHEEALRLLKPGFLVQTAKLSSDAGTIGYTASQISFSQEALGNYDEAFAMLVLALSCHQQAWGPDSHTVAQSHENLASLEVTRGRFSEAVAQAQKAVAVRERNDSPELLAHSLDRLAGAQLAASQIEAAKKSCLRAQGALSTVPDATAPMCLSRLGLGN